MVQNIKKYWGFAVAMLMIASVSGLLVVFQSPNVSASSETIKSTQLEPNKQVNLASINESYCDSYSGAASGDNVCKYSQLAQAGGTNPTPSPGDASTGDSPSEAGSATTPAPTCASLAGGIGWWVCAPLEMGIGFSDFLWSLMETLLVTNPLSESEVYYQPWGVLRNVANTLLAVIFLVVVFSQISNIGISNYGIKKMLPRLIIVAVLINISFLIVQISVDLANILGSELTSFMDKLTEGTAAPTWGEALQTIITQAAAGAAIGGIVSAAGSAAGWPAIILLLVVLLILAIIGILIGMLTLVIRNGLIPIIAILAPVAFVAYALPNTQGLFDKWKKLFLGIVFLYPAAALYMGALQFASYLLVSGGGIVETLVGLTALFVGSAFVPIIALKSNSTMSKVYGGLSNAVGKVTRPATKLGLGVAGGMAALRFAQLKNMDNSSRRGPGSRGFLGRKKITRAIGRTGQWFDTSSMARKTAMDAAGVGSQEIFKDKLLENYDPDDPNSVNEFALKAAGGDRQAAREMQRKVHLARKEENFKKASAELTEDFNRPRTTDDDTYLRDRILQASSESERDAALHRAASMGRDSVIRDVQSAAHYSGDKSLAAATSEAIEANKSVLLAKSPELVKGEGAAFSNVTGRQLSQFSNQTIQRYMHHLSSMPVGAKKDAAIESFNSAIEDIQRSPDIQADFRNDAGRTILEEYNKYSTQMPALGRGVGNIDGSSGKIRTPAPAPAQPTPANPQTAGGARKPKAPIGARQPSSARRIVRR